MGSYEEIGNTGISYWRNNVLGKGAYGDVYRGIFEKEIVAVKKIQIRGSTKEEREVILQKGLKHSNVLSIRNVAEDKDFRYIVLELCAGTLGQVIDKTYLGPALPPDRRVLYQIADGLDYIHTQRLIHRDVKPENILISLSGQMKLSDFGLSKQISTRDTCSMSGRKGTLLWMAPELRGNNENNRATPKCDVFPCGCVFFAFVTRENGGIHPFGDTNDHIQIGANIRDGKPVNMHRLGSDHFAAVVIGKMLERDPSNRMPMTDVKNSFIPVQPNSFISNATTSSNASQNQQQNIPVLSSTPQASPNSHQNEEDHGQVIGSVIEAEKKVYSRQFMLELWNKPTSQTKPKVLPNLEIVCDRPKKSAFKVREERDTRDDVKIEVFLATFSEILNELTPFNFAQQLAKIKPLDMDTEERLVGVTNLFYEKAIKHVELSIAYAQICKILLCRNAVSVSNPAEIFNFRKLLLTCCYREYEKNYGAVIEAIKKARGHTENGNTYVYPHSMQTPYLAAKLLKPKGDLRFIGELFNLKIIPAKIIHEYITQLLSGHELLCVCLLLVTVGKAMDSPPVYRKINVATISISKNQTAMKSYFSELDAIMNNSKISDPLRSMIQDVANLRKNGWNRNPKWFPSMSFLADNQPRKLTETGMVWKSSPVRNEDNSAAKK